MSFKVKINNVEIHNGQNYDLHLVNSKDDPIITFNKDDNKCYTYCIIDTKAPITNKFGKTEWLHWLVVNCSKSNNDEKIVMSYKPPTPPKNSGIHKYYICLYEQQNKIDVSEMTDNRENRLNFSMDDFIVQYNLKCIGSIFFMTSFE